MHTESIHERLQQYFFAILLLITFIVTFMILRPFLAPLLLALSLGITFMPIHRRIRRRFGKWNGISAFISVVLVLVVVLLPIALVSFLLFGEAANLYGAINSGNIPTITYISSHINNTVGKFIPGYSINIPSYLQSFLQWTLSNFGALFSELLKIFLETFLLLLTLFYFFKSGPYFRKRLSELSPLKNEYDQKIFDRLTLAVSSIVRGSLIVAVLQGIMATLGVWLFGLPSPLIWGVSAAAASFVPGVGTLIVMGPAIIWLLVFHNFWHGIGLLIWYIFSVALIDNFLSPHIIERGLKIHSLFVLVSILGGLELFGPIGFILGPLILAFLFALLDIYPLIVKGEKA